MTNDNSQDRAHCQTRLLCSSKNYDTAERLACLAILGACSDEVSSAVDAAMILDAMATAFKSLQDVLYTAFRKQGHSGSKGNRD